MYDPPRNSNNRSVTIVAVVLGVVACLCVCVAALGGGAAYLISTTSSIATQFSTQVRPQLTEIFQQPTNTPRPAKPTTGPDLVLTPVPTPVAGISDTLQTLDAAVIPPSDLRELAMRLKGIPNIPDVVATAAADYKVGQELSFNASNQDTNATFKVQAKLIYETTNVYFFAQDGNNADLNAVKSLVDTFQNKIYPTDRAFFGSEWNPGVDADPHVYILYVGGIGHAIAGYFSSADEYSHLAHPFSHEKEMF